MGREALSQPPTGIPEEPASAADDGQGLVGGSVVLALSRVWSQIASGLLFLATSIAITPTEFGQFAIATSIYAALAVCVGQGTYEYVIKARDNDNAAPTVFLLNIATATLASLAAVLISVLIPHIIDGPEIPQVLLLMIPVFFLSAMTTLLESVIMKRGAVQKVGYTTLIADTVSLVLALISLKLGAGVFSLVVQRVVREFMIMATYGVANSWKPRLLLDKEEARQAIKFARSIVGIRIIGLGSTAVIDVTIGALLGAKEAGIYRLVTRLLTIGADILFQPFRAALWVRLPPLHNDAPALRRTYMELVEVFGVGMFAAMTGITLIAGPIFGLFFKPEWQDAVPLVALMAIGRLVFVPGMAGEVIFALRNHMRFMMQFSVASSVLMIGGAFLSAHFGLTAFVITGIAVMVLLQSWQLPQMCGCMDLKLSEYLRLFGRLTVNGALMAAVVVPMTLAEKALGANLWVQGGSAIVVGAVVYILAARKFTPIGYAAYAAGLAGGVAAVQRRLSRALSFASS